MQKSAILAVFCARSMYNSASRGENTNLAGFCYEIWMWYNIYSIGV